MPLPSGARKTVILVGGSSRAGRWIARALAGHQVVPVVRTVREPGQVQVEDYREVPPGLPLSGATIVNCVGVAHGTPEHLERVNGEVPLRWAEAGRSEGASHFIQISSFSVYGPASEVRADTLLNPISAYGLSKLHAERALAAMAPSDLAVSVLRTPILVGDGTDKLARLVSLAKLTGLVPLTKRPAPRSMLTYAGLADVVACLVSQPVAAPVNAADPEPFTYALMIEAARAAGRTLRGVPVPRMAQALLARAAPELGRSLFEPMQLTPEANYAAGLRVGETLRQVLVRAFAAA